MTIRVAVIGFGGMGRMHASQIVAIPGCQLVAIADIDEKKLSSGQAQEINIGAGASVDLAKVKKYPGTAEMLAAGGVDAVNICVPTPDHAPIAIQCLEAGVHVLCEKPMARTVKQAQDMVRAAEKSGKVLMIAQCIRFWSEYEVLEEVYRSGRFGSLNYLTLRRAGAPPKWTWNNWMMDGACSGGAMLDMHVHDTDFVVHLLGMPKAVFTTARKLDTGAYDACFTQYVYPDGPIVHTEGTWCLADGFNMSFIGNFAQGTVQWDSSLGQPVKVQARGKDPETAPPPADNAYKRENAYFHECIRAGKQPEKCLPTSSCQGLQVAFAEHESADTGMVVNL